MPLLWQYEGAEVTLLGLAFLLASVILVFYGAMAWAALVALVSFICFLDAVWG